MSKLDNCLIAVRRCEEYILAHLDERPKLAALSAVSGVGKRTLINAFRIVTGSSPIAYLKALRLTAAHRALREADPQRTRVIDVAANWGFWHLGHFARDYRALFGETPSQTLLRSAEERCA